jgi:hypothetical protein
MIKDGWDPDRPHTRKARGLASKKLASTKGDQARHGDSNVGVSLKLTYQKPSKESLTPPSPRGLHLGGCAHTHPPESDDATTLVHNSPSLCKSVHTPAKARGLLSGT